jgi:anhydro-N-acetylmuramic acid kinase
MTVLTAIGLMSGTSLDGIDLAILKTDGENFIEHGPTHSFPYSRDLKIFVRRAIKAAQEGRDGAADIGKASGEVTEAHAIAVAELLDKAGTKRTAIDVIGFHGHTLLHRPKRSEETVGRTWQIGDGKTVAEETKIDVVSDFRAADVAEGGEGGPLSPVYYAALVRALQPKNAVGVINLGDASTVTYVPPGGGNLDLVAFDCGPGDDLVNQWMEMKAGMAADESSAMARVGKVHTDILRMMILNPFIRRKPPKTLAHHDFKIDPVLGLSLADGAATLTAFAAACVRASVPLLPSAPGDWIVVGPGRRNSAMMEALRKALDGEVHEAESVGWRGDALEAECLAYLAVRSLRKLPLSFPKTTRVPRPMRGGAHHRAPV